MSDTTTPRLSDEVITAVERILSKGRKAEIIRAGDTLIVKEITRKTAYKTAQNLDRTTPDSI